MACKAMARRGFLQADTKDHGAHANAKRAHCGGCDPSPATDRAETTQRQIIRDVGRIRAPKPQRALSGALGGASVDLPPPYQKDRRRRGKPATPRIGGAKRDMPPLWAAIARTSAASRNSDSRRRPFGGDPIGPPLFATAGRLRLGSLSSAPQSASVRALGRSQAWGPTVHLSRRRDCGGACVYVAFSLYRICDPMRVRLPSI